MFTILKLLDGKWVQERQKSLSEKLNPLLFSTKEEAERIGFLLYGNLFNNSNNFKIQKLKEKKNA